MGETGRGIISGLIGDGIRDVEPSNSDDIASRRDSASTSTSGLGGIDSASCDFVSCGSRGPCVCCSVVASDGDGGAVGFVDEGLENVKPFHIHLRLRTSMVMLPKGFVALMVSLRCFALKARDTVRSGKGFSTALGDLESAAGLGDAGVGGIRESMWLISTLGYPDSMSLVEGTT